MLNDNRLTEIDNIPDEQIFKLLKTNNSEMWQYVFMRVVEPICHGTTKNGIPYQKILSDKLLESEDVWGELYYEMMGRNKLDLYNHSGSLVRWMRYYVINFILGFCKKNPNHESDECLDQLYISRTDIHDIAEVNETSFAELWRESPMRAYVFLLKSQESYSSEEIKDCLGLTSSNNVDQYYRRAKQDLKDFIKKNSGDAQ